MVRDRVGEGGMSATVWCGCVQVASLGERCPQAERCTKLAEKREALAAASSDIVTGEGEAQGDEAEP